MNKVFLICIFLFIPVNILFAQTEKEVYFLIDQNDTLIIKQTGTNGKGPEGFFSKKGDYYNLKPSEILCLKDYLHSLKIRKNRFSYLLDHFAQFKVFLVKEEKGKSKFIEIITGMEIF